MGVVTIYSKDTQLKVLHVEIFSYSEHLPLKYRQNKHGAYVHYTLHNIIKNSQWLQKENYKRSMELL